MIGSILSVQIFELLVPTVMQVFFTVRQCFFIAILEEFCKAEGGAPFTSLLLIEFMVAFVFNTFLRPSLFTMDVDQASKLSSSFDSMLSP